MSGHRDEVWDVAMTADGRRAVSASGDSTVKVWDLESGRCITTFTCDAGAMSCSFAEAQIIVVGDYSGRVHFLRFEE
jgi:WD40 repeat protein